MYMPENPIELEYYPKLPQELLKKAVDKINENKSNWEDPFFMDVYGYADLAHFKELCKPYLEDPNLKNLIILGTGGSYQTMKALSLFAKKNIHFLYSSRPHELSEVLFRTLPENSLIIPISRGGKTIDVNSILPLFKEYKILALSSQGPMNDMVKKFNATILPVPDLSGRFAASVCSVMLVPALISGIKVDQVQKGLEDGYVLFKNLDTSNLDLNIALQYAVFVYHLYQKGYRNIFSMPYSQWLEGLTGLLVQEISESTGKEGTGILGTYQAAPLCQHSVLELILGGSKGHSSPLLWTTLQEPTDVILKLNEKEAHHEGENPMEEGITALSVVNYQLDATFQALLEQKVPSSKLTFHSVSPYSFGFGIAFIQTTVYYLCLLLNVNWSSNPMVNIGKKICNEAIKNKLNRNERIQNRIEVANKEFNNFFSD
jgi:glucose-6-phosphate isomerase